MAALWGSDYYTEIIIKPVPDGGDIGSSTFLEISNWIVQLLLATPDTVPVFTLITLQIKAG